MINVIARIDVVPGKVEEFVEIFEANVPNVRAEAGCIRYELCRDFDCELYTADVNALTVVESWTSLEALKAHLASAHMKRYCEDVKELRTGTRLTLLEPVK